MIGSIGSTEGTVAPRQVLATDLGTGTMSTGELSLGAGLVGTDITAATYTSPTQGTVHRR
jgi:tetrahydromethanopterin S-methyltransferase subunit C